VIISNIEYREDNGVVSVVARITADKGRFSRDVYVQSDNGNLLSAEPSAFLLAAYLPAWAMGEREIIVEGDICPVLLANFKVSASILRHWFSDFGVAPHVTSGVARRVPADGAAVFMSAGVDSMHTLFELTEHLPFGHSDRPTGGVLLDYRGMSLGDDEALRRFDERRERCKFLLGSRGLEFDWIRTNIRSLKPEGKFWTRRYHGAVLAAMAHFCSNKYGRFYISSSIAVNTMPGPPISYPWGSHPMLDPFYSSGHMQIKHYGTETAKADKIRELGSWVEGLKHLHVCVSKTDSASNCGRCKKCIKTKMYLAAHGINEAFVAFKDPRLTAKNVADIKINAEWLYRTYSVLGDRLEALDPTSKFLAPLKQSLSTYKKRKWIYKLFGK